MIAIRAVEGSEFARDENLAVSGAGDGKHVPVRAQAGIETSVETAVCVESCDTAAVCAVERHEQAAQQNFAIRLPHDRGDAGLGSGADIEAGVERSICVEPRDVIAAHAVDGREIAAKQNLAARCCREGHHRIIRARVRHEPGVAAAVGV